MSTTLPAGVKRFGVPFLLKDVVIVSDAALIRKIASNPDITRSGGAELPWIIQKIFLATQFYYPKEDRWHIASLGDEQDNRPNRRHDVEEYLKQGFNEDQISRLVELVEGDGNVEYVRKEAVKVVAEIIGGVRPGQKLPQEIADAAAQIMFFLPIGVGPGGYLRGRAAREKLENYCVDLLPDGSEIVDYVHNLATPTAFGDALMALRNTTSPNPKSYFLNNPLLPILYRFPKKTTTVGGLFPQDSALKPGSVIILDLASAAKATQDEKFLFGTGLETRQCPFKGVFFDTVDKIQSRRLK